MEFMSESLYTAARVASDADILAWRSVRGGGGRREGGGGRGGGGEGQSNL